ncbi:MraY family glycosyltransferase [Aquimarina agarivorans]|uniref:MraY family glycosyltransferase n=1 Tax=Aquimarina agarivorans TaxID=980584 RepID=UPI000248EB6E|nr:MraY family glycosyltransferase [Aquimarina agarivorans]
MFCVDTTEIEGVNYFYVSLTLLFFTGLRDDLLPIDSLKKLLLQIVAVVFVVVMCDVKLESMYSLDYFNLGQFPVWISYPLTIFTIVILVNAFNLIDGIDGLAASVATLLCVILGFWFAINGFWGFASLCFIMLGALLGFLYYNWSPAKIFMGDTGSLIIGFFCTVILITFLELNTQAAFKIKNSISFTALLFIYPIFDTIRVIILRVRRKKSPFAPDKRHIHLSLRRLGLSHRQVTSTIFLTSLLLIVFHYLISLTNLNEFIVIALILIICLSLHYILMQRIMKFKKDKKRIDLKKLSISNVQVILKNREN